MNGEKEEKGLGYAIRFGLAHAALMLANCALRFSVWCLRVPEIEEETPAAP